VRSLALSKIFILTNRRCVNVSNQQTPTAGILGFEWKQALMLLAYSLEKKDEQGFVNEVSCDE
jgi:hypothetical protein